MVDGEPLTAVDDEADSGGEVEATADSPLLDLPRLKLEDRAALVDDVEASFSEPEAVEAESTSGTEERQGRLAAAAADV